MNLLLHTDVYKMGHLEQYNPDIQFIQSHMVARSNKFGNSFVLFGLQYYLQKYLTTPITVENVAEFLNIRESILGQPASQDIKNKLDALVNLGYIPLKIHSYREGSLQGIGEPVIVVENTVAGFHWVVGLVESLLLKVWNTSTVATYSKGLKDVFTNYCEETGGIKELIPFQVHDFGYRGCSSEETAALSGSAHLLNFLGTDTVLAVDLLRRYYKVDGLVGASVPASEHSVMCSFGKDREIEAFRHMLNLYPVGIVSIVSDTYDLWNVLDNFTDQLRDLILNRVGKVVFRPDSGNPTEVILKSLEVLGGKFGTTTNEHGYKMLHPNVGLIYGDGMYKQRIIDTLEQMKQLGWCSSNLVIGVGGLLLQSHSRDDLGFAFKANNAVLTNGEELAIYKDPITDKKKASIKGRINTSNMFMAYYNGQIFHQQLIRSI